MAPHTTLAPEIEGRIERLRNGCWEWRGEKNNGYGRLTAQGVPIAVAQVVWAAERGPLKEGAQLGRTCNNKLCVNPWHMRPLSSTATVPYSFKLNQEQTEAVARTGRSMACVVEDALAHYVPMTFKVPWPSHPRDCRRGPSLDRDDGNGQIVHVFMQTAEQASLLLDLAGPARGARKDLLMDALASYLGDAWPPAQTTSIENGSREAAIP